MSTYGLLAALPLGVESIELLPLSSQVSQSFTRRTTVVKLRGQGHEGLGEDVTYDTQDQQAFQDAGPDYPLSGSQTLDSFSARLDELNLFPKKPSQAMSMDYRRWAFESAALDLALCQAGVSLAQRLEIRPAALRFVVSMGLGSPPSTDRVLNWLELDPKLAFKLDAGSDWDDALIAQLASTGAVKVVDFKGAYRGTPVDQAPDAEMYRRVAQGLPDVWIEDPALTAETREVLAPHLDRVTWDAPIHSVEDILALEQVPRTINIKPSRFGSLRALMQAYDHCNAQGISMYGGGQFELGPGRGQIQYLASLFHAEGSNDVAPVGYNAPEPVVGLASSPLVPDLSPVGFRWNEV